MKLVDCASSERSRGEGNLTRVMRTLEAIMSSMMLAVAALSILLVLGILSETL